MNLDLLKTFHSVAKNKSFTKAANELLLTQPAVSLQIQNLEHSLRTTLFDRRKRNIELTDEGRILYSYTRKLFSIFSDIENAFQDLSELQIGSLSIASSSVIGTYFLPEMLVRFRQSYPKIDVQLRIGNSEKVAQWVQDREADIGLCGHIEGHHNFVQYQLLNESYRVVASPDSPWAHLGRALTVQEFERASIITREKGARSQHKLDRWLQNNGGANFKGGVAVNSMETAKHLAMSGLGIVTLPELTVQREVKSGQLIYLDVEGFNLNTGYYLNYLKDSNLSPAALKFLMLLKENRRDFMAIL